MLIKELINPSSIAVIGGSNNLSTPGGRILYNLIKGGYLGKLYAVNSKINDKTIQDTLCYQTIQELPNVDLAIIAVSAKASKEIVETLIQFKGTKAFIILSAGFSELGEEGRRLENEIGSMIKRAGGSLIGPNCIGVLTNSYAGIFAGPIPKLDKAGCDFVSGSGATACFTIEKGVEIGLTFSSIFSIGNGTIISVEEILEYWDTTFDFNSSSKIKLIYTENIKNPQKFLHHASSLRNKGCFLAGVKAGESESGIRAASSHTGALATSDIAAEILFKKAGVIRCRGREELLQVASLFQHQMAQKLIEQMKKESRKTKIAVITHAGGPGVMLVDALSSKNIEVPTFEKNQSAQKLLNELYLGSSVQNPIDFLATGSLEQLEKIVSFVENDAPEIDASVIIFGHTGLIDVKPIYSYLATIIPKLKKPLWLVTPSVSTGRDDIEFLKNEFGFALFTDEVSLGKNLGNVINFLFDSFDFQEKVKNDELIFDSEKIAEIGLRIKRERAFEHSTNDGKGYLNPKYVKAILDASGIKTIPEEIATSIPSALSAYSKISNDILSTNQNKVGVVMKVIGPIHKTEVSGVVLNVQSIDEMRSEFTRLMEIQGAKGVLFQPMVKGLELFIGANDEGAFGKMIVIGLGGIFVEVMKDLSFGLTPISRNEASTMIHSLKAAKIIEGVRGKKGVKIELLENYLMRISKLLEVMPEIVEMDINPLISVGEELYAVDARICIKI